jgi:hypothetical protein
VSKKAWRKPIHHQEVGRVANELKAKRSTKRLLIFYFSPEMMAYKNYCNRRTAKKKGQDPEESHCCPLRMPIIGPILFSLFIFSPFILPTSDRENLELVSDSTVEEPRLTKDDSLPILEIPDNDQHSSLP